MATTAAAATIFGSSPPPPAIYTSRDALPHQLTCAGCFGEVAMRLDEDEPVGTQNTSEVTASLEHHEQAIFYYLYIM